MAGRGKKWDDLSTGQQRAIIAAGAVEAVLKVIALRDLKRRPAGEVKGPKWVWLLVILVNSAGLTSASYLLFGRKRAQGSGNG